MSLSYMLNDKGGIVSEFTITRLGEDKFYLMSAAAAEWHDLDWLDKLMPKDGAIRVEKLSAR
jgi:dimethylglycine dehydrogenase